MGTSTGAVPVESDVQGTGRQTMGRKRFNLLIALSLAVGLLAGAIVTTGAQGSFAIPHGDRAPGAFFPWVPNGADLDGTGPFFGTLTVQNLSDEPMNVYLFPGLGSDLDAWNHPNVLGGMAPNATATVTAASLDLAQPGGSVRVHAIPVDFSYSASEGTFVDGDGAEIQPADYGKVAGVVKSMSPSSTGSASSTASTISVDGYSGLDTAHLTSSPTGAYRYVVPIVQTNDGWNTELRIANFGAERMSPSSSSVNIMFYEAGGAGADDNPDASHSGAVRSGGVLSVNLLEDTTLGDEFVGAAFLTSNEPLGIVAERFKPNDQMLMMNTGRGEAMDTSTQVAPLVFRNFNSWNSGISVVNLSDLEGTTVTVSYVSVDGDIVETDQIDINRRSMNYIFSSGIGNTEDDAFVGAAIIQSSNGAPIQAVVDQVKYFGDADDVGDAMSYVTDSRLAGTAAGASGNQLALPLVQKGIPETNIGDTTGVQLFNPNPDTAVSFTLQIFGQDGHLVAPTIIAPLPGTLAGHQSVTFYVHNHEDLRSHFTGSMVVTVDPDGQGTLLSAVSNNVNYQIAGDGSSVFTLPVIGDAPEPGDEGDEELDEDEDEEEVEDDDGEEEFEATE